MTGWQIVFACIAAFCILQAIRAWGPTNKERGAAAVYIGVAILFLVLSGVIGFLNKQA